MRGKQLYFIFFILLFFIACGTNNTYFSSKNYKKNVLYYQYLTVIPDITEFVSKADKDKIYTNKIINNKPLSEFEKQILIKNLKVAVESNSYINCLDISIELKNNNMKFEEKVYSDFSKSFYLPNDFNLIKSNYIFIVQDASFKLDYSNVGGTLGSTGTNVFYLAGELEYVLVDKNRQEIISFGTASDKISSLKAPTNDEYIKLINQLISRIIINSPFKKKDFTSIKINKKYF